MKIIKKLSESIAQELDKALDAAKCAVASKEDDLKTAEAYMKVSNNHMASVGILHDRVVGIIKEYEDTHEKKKPEHMMVLYSILHDWYVAKSTAVKEVQALYASMK